MRASTIAILFLAAAALPADATIDQNADGLSDCWSDLYPIAGSPTADPDGDGVANLAEALAARFRVVTPDPSEEKKKLDEQEKKFVAAHSAKFEDAKAAQDFFRASPEQAETLVSKIRVPAVAHRGGGSPEDKGALTPKAVHAKYTAMPEGKEKEDFFDAHRIEINAGAVAVEAEQK